MNLRCSVAVQVAREADGDVRERVDSSVPARTCRLHPVRHAGRPPVGHRHEPVREQQRRLRSVQQESHLQHIHGKPRAERSTVSGV